MGICLSLNLEMTSLRCHVVQEVNICIFCYLGVRKLLLIILSECEQVTAVVAGTLSHSQCSYCTECCA